jgi:hypothetical protein
MHQPKCSAKSPTRNLRNKRMQELTSRLSLLALTGILAGCATGYHPLGSFAAGGYSEMDGVTPDRVAVAFDGDQWTQTQRAWDFALLRAGELCGQRGFSYLSILSKERDMTVSYEDFPGKAWIRRDGSAEGISPSETIEVNHPHAELEVQFYKERPMDAANAFAASAIIQQIRAKYRM